MVLLHIHHSDLMRTMKSTSSGDSISTLTFIEYYSWLVKAYFLRTDSQWLNDGMSKSTRSKCIRADSGIEHLNRRFEEYCRRSGIVHHTTVPFSQQQSSLAEGINIALMERARAMMKQKNATKGLVGESYQFFLDRDGSANLSVLSTGLPVFCTLILRRAVEISSSLLQLDLKFVPSSSTATRLWTSCYQSPNNSRNCIGIDAESALVRRFIIIIRVRPTMVRQLLIYFTRMSRFLCSSYYLRTPSA